MEGGREGGRQGSEHRVGGFCSKLYSSIVNEYSTSGEARGTEGGGKERIRVG